MKISPRRDTDDQFWPRSKDEFDGVTHTYVRIARKPNGRTSFSRKAIHDGDIPEICAKTRVQRGTDWSLNLIIIYDDNFQDSIPYTLETMEALRRFWYMPDSLFDCWKTNQYHAMTTDPQPGNEEWRGVCFYVRVADSAGVAISHHVPTRTTFAVICPLEGPDGDCVLGQLRFMRRYATEPLLLPLLIVSLARRIRDKHVRDLNYIWVPMQRKMGCDYLTIMQMDDAPEVNLRDMPRALTQLANSVVLQRQFLSIMDRLCDCLLEELKGTETRRSKQLSVQFRDHIAFEKQCFKQMTLRIENLLEMTRNQVQMVYAVLQARDNETNLRYGADMRVISAVTLIFLPGTFVATMFSTSFWNFDPSTTGPVVSSWIWLYWTLTAILTAAVLAVWRNFLLLKGAKQKLSSAWEQIADVWQQSPVITRIMQRENDHEKTIVGPKDRDEKKQEDKHDEASTHSARPSDHRPSSNWRTIRRRRWLGRRRRQQELDVELAENGAVTGRPTLGTGAKRSTTSDTNGLIAPKTDATASNVQR